MGLSAKQIFKGKWGSVSLFVMAALDLQTISFNCYDRRYAELYQHQIAGDLNKTLDTVHNTLKTFIGVADFNTNPFREISTKLNWNVLLSGTTSLLAIQMVSKES